MCIRDSDSLVPRLDTVPMQSPQCCQISPHRRGWPAVRGSFSNRAAARADNYPRAGTGFGSEG
eukprot:15218848-Alexandrium_andersonii.AAC.1